MRRRTCEERVRVWDLLDGGRFLYAPFLLALPLLFALVQLLGRLGNLQHNSGVLLQVLAPGRLGLHDDAGAVHPRGGLEIQLAAVLLPAFDLGVMLFVYVPRRHGHFENLKRSEGGNKQNKSDVIRKVWGKKIQRSPHWKINPIHVGPFKLEL